MDPRLISAIITVIAVVVAILVTALIAGKLAVQKKIDEDKAKLESADEKARNIIDEAIKAAESKSGKHLLRRRKKV